MKTKFYSNILIKRKLHSEGTRKKETNKQVRKSMSSATTLFTLGHVSVYGSPTITQLREPESVLWVICAGGL